MHSEYGRPCLNIKQLINTTLFCIHVISMIFHTDFSHLPDVSNAVGKLRDGSFDEDGVNVSFLKLLKEHVDVWHDFVK